MYSQVRTPLELLFFSRSGGRPDEQGKVIQSSRKAPRYINNQLFKLADPNRKALLSVLINTILFISATMDSNPSMMVDMQKDSGEMQTVLPSSLFQGKSASSSVITPCPLSPQALVTVRVPLLPKTRKTCI